jgi:LysR family transcriptional regulator, transcriptional activator for bauABCD operon
MKKPLLGQVSDLDLRLLRVFRTVVESGGFAAAELQLNIGRSTISRHIKDLETRLGLSLCRRGRGGFALTPEGSRIYQSTLRVLGSIADLRSEIHDLHQRLSGSLQLALFDKTVTNPQARISGAIGELRRRAPDVTVEIRIHPLNEIERGILDGRFHVGVLPVYRRSGACEYHPLFDETMYLYCGRSHPLFAREDGAIGDAEVQTAAFAGLGFHSDNMERGHEFGLDRRATAYDQEGVATLILSGAYLGFLPDHYAASFVEQGQMRAIRREHFTYRCSFGAIVRRDAQRPRLAQTFLDLLLAAHSPAPVRRTLQREPSPKTVRSAAS